MDVAQGLFEKVQLVALYTGKKTDWKDMSSFDEPVTLVNKEIGRNTLGIFEEYSG